MEKLVSTLTAIAIVALIINYPTVPVRAAQSIAGAIAGVIGLAKPQ